MGTFRRVMGWLKPYKRRFIWCLVFIIFLTALRSVFPYITQAVVNDVIPNRNMTLLLQLCGVMLGIVAIRNIIMYKRGMMIERISQDVVFDLRTGLYRHMQELPFSFYDKHHIGEIMSRMTGDVEGARMLIINCSVGVFENFLVFVFGMAGMALMSWQLLITMLLLCPLIVWTAWIFNKKIRPAHIEVREQNAVLNTRTQENIAGVRVVKAFAREGYEEEEFYKDNQKLLEDNLKVTRIWSNYYPLMDLVASFALPLMLLVGAIMVTNGSLSIGTMIGATGYVWMLVDPMRQVASYVNMVANGIVSSEKLIYYLDFGSNIKNPEAPIEPAERKGAVEYEGVTFRYGDKTVLKDIDLNVSPGETIAVMGATGTGKTTLVTLMGRYYDIREGALKIDGVDVRSQDLHALRHSIGMVMQETFLFSETIFNNIRFGHPDASKEQVEAAARVAQAEEFILKMPDGYETIVGERGLGLSGGQKQRLALARAVLFDPKILILDDATSAVDMETEAEIQDALQSVMKGRTTFIIAHRISSVRRADQIIVLEGETIAERGTHNELLKKQGLYYEMFMDQTRDFAYVENVEKAGE